MILGVVMTSPATAESSAEVALGTEEGAREVLHVSKIAISGQAAWLTVQEMPTNEYYAPTFMTTAP